MKLVPTVVIIAAIAIGILLSLMWLKKRNPVKTNQIDKKLEDKIAELSSINESEVDTTEDRPIDFGYKVNWLAIKTTDQIKVANSLGAKTILKSNWESGLNIAYKNATFITPPIDGWTLAVNFYPVPDDESQIDKVEELLIRLSKLFGEVQLFGTHRVVEFHCWLKAVEGKIVREYSYLGEKGENIVVNGVPSEIESKLNLVNTFSEEAQKDNYWEREDLTIPDEELVNKVAESWSVNPTTLSGRTDIKGLGLLIK